MKINPIMLIISFFVAALAGYGFYAGNANERFVLLLAIGSGISVFLTLGTIFSVGVKSDSRFSANVKLVAAIFLVLLFIENLIFAFTVIAVAPYIIATGILLLVFVTICYAISKSS